ncbi:MAG TPA: class I SAM-dependent methyltransferase [Vicinamibacterales bacterium]|jgi:cyclopropane-fatty-acyl-phospholipid synthase
MGTANDTLFGVLDAALTQARVRFILPDRTYDVGQGGDGDLSFIVRVSDPRFARRVLTSGNLGLAETYMNGGWAMEHGTLDRLLATLALADVDRLIRRDPRLVARIAAMRLGHALTNSTRRVRPHYDVDAEVYELFLDETMGYSCGYQQTPGDSLQTLQENKYDRVCRKLQLREGERLLDIGCGWGGLIIHAARKYGVRAHGISPAPNQVEKARARARALGLESLVTAEVADFRAATGVYDKISSVGMFEHLYPHEHAAYFARIRSLLTDEGIGLVHFMGCTTDKNDPDPFIQTYIYPGSTQPQLSLAVKGLEREKLAVLDVENIARHYHPTAEHWSERFRANKHQLDPGKYDARFIRMFEYLMAVYIAGTTALVAGVFQVLFTRDFRKNLPWHRV